MAQQELLENSQLNKEELDEESLEEELENLKKPFKLKIGFLRRIFNCFFTHSSKAFSWSGDYPNFEKEVVWDECKAFTFSFHRLFWERVFNETRPLNSSIRAKRLNKQEGW